LCLRTLALDERARLDQASIMPLKRSLDEAQQTAASLRAQPGSPGATEALSHLAVVSVCVRGLLQRGADMDLDARRRVLVTANQSLHQLDELTDSIEWTPGVYTPVSNALLTVLLGAESRFPRQVTSVI